MPDRRFPPPWSVEETDSCYIVRDANEQALAYVYFEGGAGAAGGGQGGRRMNKGAGRQP